MATLIVTLGTSSVDLYAQKLAQELDAPKIYSDIYQKVVRLFNISWLSKSALRAIQEDWRFIRLLNRVDGMVHLPNQHLGRYGNFLKKPYVITVHDTIRYLDLKGYGTYIHHPNLRDRWYLNLDYKGVKKATRIIAVSQFTKRNLMHDLGIPGEQISVIHEGVDHKVFRPLPRSRSSKYSYILFVGSEQPRKNLSLLLRAFGKLKKERRFGGLKLVKVGKAGGPEAAFRRQTMELIEALGLIRDVIFTDYVLEEELPGYYSNAECLALPSLYEGFGLPVLEAMACGCPVIISNCTSLPEIAGKAAIQADPYDLDGLVRALWEVLTDADLRDQMVRKGLARANKFSWRKAASETLGVYQDLETV